MGRKRISDKDKIMRGTDQPVRMSGDSDLMEPVSKLPSTPGWLNKSGRKMYRTLGQSMVAAGILNELNVVPFSMLCNEIGKYVELSNDIKVEGYTHTWDDEKNNRTVITANPKVKQASDSLKNAKVLASEFGMTPASLAKIASMINTKEDKDPYEDFKNG